MILWGGNMGLAEKIMENSSELDKLQLYWLGGAGFIIKINGIK